MEGLNFEKLALVCIFLSVRVIRTAATSKMDDLMNSTTEIYTQKQGNDLIQVLPDLEYFNMPLHTINQIWEDLKDDKAAHDLDLNFINKTKNILPFIREDDLYHLNIANEEILKLLGMINFDLRRKGIILYALINSINPEIGKEIILKNATLLNNLRGLICGFQIADLKKITPEILLELNAEVFYNLYPCPRKRMRVLMTTATAATSYGPPHIWTKKETAKLGYLLTVLKEEELVNIRDTAFAGITRAVITKIIKENHITLAPHQVIGMNEPALAEYRKISNDFAPISNAFSIEWNLFIIIFNINAYLIYSFLII